MVTQSILMGILSVFLFVCVICDVTMIIMIIIMMMMLIHLDLLNKNKESLAYETKIYPENNPLINN